jgi:hypothetical protein
MIGMAMSQQDTGVVEKTLCGEGIRLPWHSARGKLVRKKKAPGGKARGMGELESLTGRACRNSVQIVEKQPLVTSTVCWYS